MACKLMVYQAKLWFCLSAVILALLPGARMSVVLGQKVEPNPRPSDRTEATYRGGLVTPPLPKPRFTLTDTSGAPFDFWRKTEGYVTLLFFGYARCPDQCPIHMGNIAMALKKLPSGFRDQVKLVFVTTDPARDTPKVLRSWLDRFDERFIGLTGSEAAIEAAQKAAGVPPASKAAGAAEDYAVAHANFVLVYTRDNLAHLIYPGGLTKQDWAHDLPQLVKEAWSSR